MKLDKLVGERFKERPANCSIESHALMMRGGYIKQVANGIYSQFLPLRRICHKIEQIIRQEMDAIDGQEVQFPVVLPASLWEQSGRFSAVGSELVRLQDRTGSPLVLGMTHEEAAVQLVQEFGSTYTRYPFMVYQIQTKFRDEARPRAGLIRVREFTMKDAYSFHTSQQDLEEYYTLCLKAYHRIFTRVGIPQTVAVLSDSGMMGGSVSHEFMLLTPIGEDSIACCPHCGYMANLETAPALHHPASANQGEAQPLQPVPTPGRKTIEEVCTFMQISLAETCKAVAYSGEATGQLHLAFLRGDKEISQSKLEKLAGEPLAAADLTGRSDIVSGYIGPVGLPVSCSRYFDSSLQNQPSLVCGANQPDTHYTGLNLPRDVGEITYLDFAKAAEGDQCPQCHQDGITIRRGIEVGNIFQLGTKYTSSMGLQYTAENGSLQTPLMGCYGIGIGRLAASICEVNRDEFGPIWPVSIAPWQVHLCCVRADDPECKTYADTLYHQLSSLGLEVLYDDRNVRPGVMFSDADLLGVPVRLIVSPRNMKENCCELVSRDKSIQQKPGLDQILPALQAALCQLSELEQKPSRTGE